MKIFKAILFVIKFNFLEDSISYGDYEKVWKIENLNNPYNIAFNMLVKLIIRNLRKFICVAKQSRFHDETEPPR